MSKPKKIAVILPNVCDPDYRAIKQAELFSAAGHEVCVFCRHKRGLPKKETINGVTYVRNGIVNSLLPRIPTILFCLIISLPRIFIERRVEEETFQQLDLKKIRAKNQAMLNKLLALKRSSKQ